MTPPLNPALLHPCPAGELDDWFHGRSMRHMHLTGVADWKEVYPPSDVHLLRRNALPPGHESHTSWINNALLGEKAKIHGLPFRMSGPRMEMGFLVGDHLVFAEVEKGWTTRWSLMGPGLPASHDHLVWDEWEAPVDLPLFFDTLCRHLSGEPLPEVFLGHGPASLAFMARRDRDTLQEALSSSSLPPRPRHL
jgi:hypothetical protein